MFQFNGSNSIHWPRNPVRTAIAGIVQPVISRFRGTFAILKTHAGSVALLRLRSCERPASRLPL